MKNIRRVFILAAVMTVAGSTAAQALPLLGIAVAAVSGAAAAVALGASTLVAVLVGASYAALSYLAQAVGGGGKANTGVTNYAKMQTGGVVPQSFLFGPFSTPGSLVYFNYWGKDGKTPNAYESRVVALSDIPIAALTGLTVDGNVCTYGSGSPDANLGYAIPEYDKDGQSYLWVKFYDGTQTVVDPFLFSQFGSDPNRPYASTRVGTGRAYVIVTIRANDQNLTSASPIRFIGQGAKWYDPRKDSSAGGSGTHRFDDPSTWDYSDNAQLIRYGIRRGVYYGAQWMFGLQNMSAARLPFDNWTAAFNECDASVTNSSGASEAQYRAGGEVSVDTEPAALDESLMRACNARSIEAGGIHLTITGAAGTATKSYTDADFVITSPANFNPYPGLSGTVNAISARFPDPSQNYEMVDAPPRYDSTLEVEDGNRQNVAEVDYDCVPFADQVQRNMAAALAEDRRWRVHDIVWPHTEWENLPGDFVSWTSDENGYSGKLFRIEKITILASRDIQATIREVDPADYSFDASADYVSRVAGNISKPALPAQDIVGWSVASQIIAGADGRAKAGIRVSWSTTDIDDVDGVVIEVRLASDASFVWSGETPHSVDQFELGYADISQNLLSATNYQVRGKYRPISQRTTNWSSWLDVTTDDVRLTGLQIADTAIDWNHLTAALQDFQQEVGEQQRQLMDEIGKLAVASVSSTLANATDVATIRSEISSQYTTITSEYSSAITTAITTATGPGSTIATDIASLQSDMTTANGNISANSTSITSLQTQVTTDGTNISTNAASITSLQSALNGYTGANAVSTAFNSLTTDVSTINGTLTTHASEITSLQSALSGYTGANAVSTALSGLQTQITSNGSSISANSTSITALNASVGRVNASAYFYAEAMATPSGADSRIVLSSSATANGSRVGASLYIDAMTAGYSRIVVEADYFMYVDSGGVTPLFQLSGGAAYLNVPLYAGAIYATNIVANNVIVTDHLQANSVTNSVVATGSSSTIPTSDTSLISVTITTQGGPVLIQFSDWCERSGGHTPYITYTLYRYSVATGLTSLGTSQVGGSGASTYMSAGISYLDAPPSAGAWYYIVHVVQSGDVSPYPYSRAPCLIATELKK